MKTVILGGGLTGVTLARLLYEIGDEVIVLEREPHYGGLCRSMSESGFTFDTGGSHIIFSRDTEVLAFMYNMLGKNRCQNKRNSKVFCKGQYVKYPFENGLYQLPKEDLFFCLNEFVRTLISVEKGELVPPKNFREWLIYTFGKGIAELYLIPYNEKIWKFPAEKMSLHWVDGRIPRPPVEDVIKAAVGIETEGYIHQAVFSYPRRGGIEALIKAIAQPIKESIQTGFAVSSIRKDDEKFTVSDGACKVAADRCISTIPLQELLKCMDDVPEHVQRSCDELNYNSLVCVFLGIKGEVPDISWLYVPDKELRLFNRVSFPSNYSPEVASPGYSSILVEITYHEGDGISVMPDREIIDHAVAALENMKITGRENVVYTALERQKYAYVIYDIDYMQNIVAVKDYIAKKDISLVGRFAEFEYLNMDGCIRSALDFVRNSK